MKNQRPPPGYYEVPYRRQGRVRRFYGKLMLAGWLGTKPDNFETNWLIKLCPAGKRCLVVAHNNTTTVYNKFGLMKDRFNSVFPGGNENEPNPNAFTVLDCIYVVLLRPSIEVYYFVLDVLAWNCVPFRQVSALTRFEWLHTRFEEVEVIGREQFLIHREFEKPPEEQNDYKFFLIEALDPSELPNLLAEPYSTQLTGINVKLDGILFYEKTSLYKMCFKNPLVGWLKPFMVQQILYPNLDLHLSYSPIIGYSVMEKYIPDTEKTKRQLKKLKKQRRAWMQRQAMQREAMQVEAMQVEEGEN
ncbi:hypothetical protein ILUMI_03593 [Ignelater luminosus]|uniref:Snurportin-1 n=1 Tax=Ignelater luminosus TaxID=2038154 RepID=A0A8K0DFY7_IGNLU|nr:hypothetical protein ILUMI_03593 [Ignelater luminosus]